MERFTLALGTPPPAERQRAQGHPTAARLPWGRRQVGRSATCATLPSPSPCGARVPHVPLPPRSAPKGPPPKYGG
ncbi:hypothetical protein ACQEVF_33975 [Nonomuraea polychroma]|uniref:hypothetical protein n=1 Tax=Nonomuraea polychroma TaxID=46176 RepID=UPI003D9126A4